MLGDLPLAGFSNGPEAFDANGRLVDSGVDTSVTLLKLPRPLRG
ncbi:hypothetical protein ACFYXM_34820 [Streptomyces sp. NPDC002476]